MTTLSAQVNILTAEVRTLVVGTRQVTLSVYKQLDYVPPWRIAPMGRVRAGRHDPDRVEVVGTDLKDGCLVRGAIKSVHGQWYDAPKGWSPIATRNEWRALPLIVLAGLR